MTTEEKQKTKENESSDDGRIPKELKSELKNKTLESESDFIFVKEMEDVNDNIVKVRFETPFAGKVLEQEFVKPDASGSYSQPELEELYNEVSATISEPDSILEVSIPNDLELLESATEVGSGGGWIPNHMEMYQKNDVSIYRRVEAAASAIAGLAGAIIVFTGSLASALLSVVILLLGLLIAFALAQNEYKPPQNSRRVFATTEVSEGDLLILDESNPTREKHREICRVVDKIDYGLEVMMRDGKTVGVSYDSSDGEWSIHHYNTGSPTIDDGYEKAYVIDKENL